MLATEIGKRFRDDRAALSQSLVVCISNTTELLSRRCARALIGIPDFREHQFLSPLGKPLCGIVFVANLSSFVTERFHLYWQDKIQFLVERPRRVWRRNVRLKGHCSK